MKLENALVKLQRKLTANNENICGKMAEPNTNRISILTNDTKLLRDLKGKLIYFPPTKNIPDQRTFTETQSEKVKKIFHTKGKENKQVSNSNIK